MSETYINLPNTNFPDSIDSFPSKNNPTTEAMELINRYKKIEMGVGSGLTELTPTELNSIKEYVFTASDYNKLRDAILAIETYYMTNVQESITNLAQNKGAWVTNTSYKTFNFVTDSTGVLYICIKQNTSSSTNAPGTNGGATYWKPLYITGELGTRWKGVYSASADYIVPDMVVYSGKIYVAKSSTTFNGQTPSSSSSYWDEVLSLDSSQIAIGDNKSLSDHINNATDEKHITTDERNNWNNAYNNSKIITHGTSAPTDSTSGDIYFQYKA